MENKELETSYEIQEEVPVNSNKWNFKSYFDSLEEAKKELNKYKKYLPNSNFRLVKNSISVIG